MSLEFIKSARKRVKKKEEIPEKDIEETFRKYAKSKNCLALKLKLAFGRGFPDRTILGPGGFIFFIEFKKKNKKQTELQKEWQNTLEKLGFKYFVCDEIGQAEKHLDKIQERLIEEFLDS